MGKCEQCVYSELKATGDLLETFEAQCTIGSTPDDCPLFTLDPFYEGTDFDSTS